MSASARRPSRLRTLVNVVQWIALVAAAAFILLLFVNEPSASAHAPEPACVDDCLSL